MEGTQIVAEHDSPTRHHGKIRSIKILIGFKISGGGMAKSENVASTKFFGQMVVSSQATQLSIHFLFRKISSVAPLWGTWLRTHYWGIEIEEKSTVPSGNRTHELKSFCSAGMCLTAVLQPQPCLGEICNKWKANSKVNWVCQTSQIASWLNRDAHRIVACKKIKFHLRFDSEFEIKP